MLGCSVSARVCSSYLSTKLCGTQSAGVGLFKLVSEISICVSRMVKDAHHRWAFEVECPIGRFVVGFFQKNVLDSVLRRHVGCACRQTEGWDDIFLVGVVMRCVFSGASLTVIGLPLLLSANSVLVMLSASSCWSGSTASLLASLKHLSFDTVTSYPLCLTVMVLGVSDWTL